MFLADCLCRLDELDLEKSLCDNLQHKTIVEFPTLVIVKKGTCVDSNTDSSNGIDKQRDDKVDSAVLNRDEGEESSMVEEAGGEECGSDWSDYEEGEIKDKSKLSSLGLIARMYS